MRFAAVSSTLCVPPLARSGPASVAPAVVCLDAAAPPLRAAGYASTSPRRRLDATLPAGTPRCRRRAVVPVPDVVWAAGHFFFLLL